MAKLDYFNINPDVKPEESLKDKFYREREEWTDKIEKMSAKLKQILEIPNLMTDLYTERQRCVEYHHYLISIMIGLSRKYKSSYADRYDYYTFKSQVRYPTESAKENRIKIDLAELIESRDMLDNHSKFMEKTIATLDNIIYAVNNRIKIEEISRGK